MTNAVMNLDDGSNVPSTVSNESSTESVFAPRLQLVNKQSKVMDNWKAEDGPAPKPGEYTLGKQVLGKPVVAIPITYRDHALQTKNFSEVSLESYKAPPKGMAPKDKDEEIFARIANAKKTENPDPKTQLTNMWGKDVLFWLPQQQKWAIMFFHSTARPASQDAYNNRGKLCLLKSDFIETKSFSWWTPVVQVSPAPSDPKEVDLLRHSLPSTEALNDERTKFYNPIPNGEGRESVVDGRPR